MLYNTNMVQVVLDHTVISDINGKFGGGYFKRAGCGLHYQQNPRKRGKGTEYQQFQNSAFARACQKWGISQWGGTEIDRYSWVEYCNFHPIKNKKGETCRMSEYSAFLSVNVPRIIENQPIIWHAPGTSDAPPPPRKAKPQPTLIIVSDTEIRVNLWFDNPMNTSITPNLADFQAQTWMTGTGTFGDLHFPGTTILSVQAEATAYAAEWFEDDLLILRFKITTKDYYINFFYVRGNTYFENVNTWRYGSFGFRLR